MDVKALLGASVASSDCCHSEDIPASSTARDQDVHAPLDMQADEHRGPEHQLEVLEVRYHGLV